MFFEPTARDPKSQARTGVIKTAHGAINTPSYVIVGTHAEVRALTPGDLEKTRTQAVISNTYHLWQKLGESLSSYQGIHRDLGWQGPVMTDSGGFQVFSLGFGREHGVGKIANIFPKEVPIKEGSDQNPLKKILGRATRYAPEKEKNLVRIADEGAYFKNAEGKEQFLGPKESIEIQRALGADIILAFDECTSPHNNYEYTKKSLARTHTWALQSLETHFRYCHSHSNYRQYLYGIVQGGEWQDLRETSTRFIGALPFDGFAIGGSLGQSRADMLRILEWSAPLLPEHKPRHLLGIGKMEDLFDCVERGIDTFDCVIPTREARHGAIWSHAGRFDIMKSTWKGDSSALDPQCRCIVCTEYRLTRNDLFLHFKEKRSDAARMATVHNISFFNDLMARIRTAIEKGTLRALRHSVIGR